jgi:hypothetical protein
MWTNDDFAVDVGSIKSVLPRYIIHDAGKLTSQDCRRGKYATIEISFLTKGQAANHRFMSGILLTIIKDDLP